MASVKELKEMIIDLKVRLAEQLVPSYHCPYAYYGSKSDIDCDEIDCDECRDIFFDEYRQSVKEWVENL